VEDRVRENDCAFEERGRSICLLQRRVRRESVSLGKGYLPVAERGDGGKGERKDRAKKKKCISGEYSSVVREGG
jgi:hypothetical protein